MKISDKTDEDVAAILGLIDAPAAVVGVAGPASGAARPQRAALLQRLSIGLAVLLLGGFGLVGWTLTRPSHSDSALVARASVHASGRTFANVLLESPRRRTEGHDRNLGGGERSPDQPLGANVTGAQAGSVRISAAAPSVRLAALSARPSHRPAQRRTPQDDGSQKYEIAKADLTLQPIAPLAFQSDRIGDDYRQGAIERPNFALTPAARAERLDALDAVRLLRQR